ncbi:hypothetical protein OEZ86_007661 [Tetradesmus obliquus]|nr:hypothetical protein OEZ86_007661 [Tetradesmus obliquus]
MAVRRVNLPGNQVWEQHTTDAADSQDVAHAAQKATAGFFALARALGLPISLLPNQQLVPVYLEGDSEAQAALRRLKERAKATGTDLFELIVSGSVAEWEAFIISSFQEGCSEDVLEATAQHQLVQEFRLLLLLGRTLCHKQPGVSMTCTRLVQHRAADGSISERQVDLMFPATERTVLRLMQAWWERKGGKPSKRQAAAAREAPEHKAMPTRFFANVLLLLYWQAQLMAALTQLK